MSVDLGSVTLGMEVNSNALANAQKSLRAFAKTVDSTVTRLDSATRGNQAFVRQEAAIRAARESLLNFNAAVKRTGADSVLIANVTRSFNALRKAMRAGELDALDYKRAQDRFRASLNAGRRGLSDYTASTKYAVKEGSKMNEILKDLVSASVLTVGPLSGLGARVAAFAAITSRSSIAMALFFGGITAGLYAVYKLSEQMIKTRMEMDKIDATLYAATGSVGAANSEFKFLAESSQKLGVRIRDVATEYALYSSAARNAGLSTAEIHRTFVAVSTAAVAMQLSGEEVGGVFKALRDIMSKGTVQSQELRDQLGNRLPGAMSLAEIATGKTGLALAKMLQQGQLLAKDFVPQFADALQNKFAGAAEVASNRMQASLNRLDNSWFLFMNALEAAVKIAAVAQYGVVSLSGALDFMTRHVVGLVSSMGALTAATLTYAAAVKIANVLGVAKLTKNIIALAAAIAVAVGVWYLMTKSIGSVAKVMKEVTDAMQKAVETTAEMKIDKKLSEIAAQVTSLKGGFAGVNPELVKWAANMGLIPDFLRNGSDGVGILTGKMKQLNDAFNDLEAYKEYEKYMKKNRTYTDELAVKLTYLNKLLNFVANSSMPKAVKDSRLKQINDELTMLNTNPFQRKVAEINLQLDSLQGKFKGVEPETVRFAESIHAIPDLLNIANNGVVTMSKDLLELNAAFRNIREQKLMSKLFIDAQTPLERYRDSLSVIEQLIHDVPDWPISPQQKIKDFNILNKSLHNMVVQYKLYQTTSGQIIQDIGNAFDDAAVKARSYSDIIHTLTQDIQRLVVHAAITGPLQEIIASSLPSFNIGPTPTPKAGSSGGISGGNAVSAKGNVFGPSGLIKFATGGIVNKPTFFPMAKGGTGLMGEAGPEAILPLKRMPGGSLGVQSNGGGGGVNVIINDYRPAGSPDVGIQMNKQDMILTLRGPVQSLIAGGHLDKTFRDNYGMRRKSKGS